MHTLEGLRALQVALKSLVNPAISGIAGLEFHGTSAELSSWVASLKKKGTALPSPLDGFSSELRARILALPGNSVHFPSVLHEKPADAAELMNAVYDFTGIRRFVVHPDDSEISTLVATAELLSPAVTISLENMDPRKRSFRTLEEIAALLRLHERFSTTLDICHWVEHGHSSESSTLLEFMLQNHSRLTGIHFSVPNSRSVEYRKHPEIVTTHYLASDSGFPLSDRFFEAIPAHATIVIEGVIPPRGTYLLKREISLLLSHGNLAGEKVRAYRIA
jgi:hypothetical protein